MALHWKFGIGFCLALALPLPVAGAAAAAGGVATPGVLLQQNELQMMQNRLQRQQFQQNQQIIREIDRQAVQPRAPREQVPVIRPGCQIQIYGNGYSGRGCR